MNTAALPVLTKDQKYVQMSTNTLKYKHIVTFPYNGILVSNKMKITTDLCNNLDVSLKHHTDNDTKVYMLHNFITMKFCKINL